MKSIDYAKYILHRCNTSGANEYEIKNAINQLENIYDIDDYNLCIILNKLYLKNKNYLKSLNFLNELKTRYKNNLSIYYYIFITNIYLDDYNEALLNLNICNSEDKIGETNNTVIYFLLNILTDSSETKIIKNEKIRKIQIYDKDLLDTYYIFIDLLEKNNYEKALDKLIECKNISRINFETEINLLKKVIVKKEQEKDKLILNTIAKKNYFLKNNDINSFIKTIYILLDNGYGSYDYYLNDVNYLINYDLNISLELLKKVKNKYHLENNYKVKYLENKINEKNNSYTEIEQYFINKGKKSCKINDFKYALVTYYTALEVTNNNVFNYYLGKILFKLKDYKSSEYYLNRYMLTGAQKYSKSLLYLYFIAKIEKKNGNEYKNRLIKINDYENISYEFCCKEFGYAKRIDKSKAIISRINMTEEEFKK